MPSLRTPISTTDKHQSIVQIGLEIQQCRVRWSTDTIRKVEIKSTSDWPRILASFVIKKSRLHLIVSANAVSVSPGRE